MKFHVVGALRHGKTAANERGIDEFLRQNPDGVVIRVGKTETRSERVVDGEATVLPPRALPRGLP